MKTQKLRAKGFPAENAGGAQLEAIKKIALVAMFSDDELMDQLVLKGGNAMDLVHRVNSRASIDLDFSMSNDFEIPAEALARVQRALEHTFDLEGYVAFDIKMTARPGKMPDELAEFWGGYLVEFKLISRTRATDVGMDIGTMRREAILLGQGPRFTIDISRFEYTADKQEAQVDGYQIFVYSPEMIVCEKLRAICQQMPDYGAIIQRSNKATERARDFIDIHALTKMFAVDLATHRAHHTVQEMFRLKRVPLKFLSQMSGMRAFHAAGFDAVKATMKTGIELQSFDFYFDFVLDQTKKLEPLWNM
ncbi:putative nucleotidyltransferase component of viral defense system [Variovorax boronicumulans]|uniref:nucleotidyl transferase AbiEii/AbiGii toxin family protein n=1 Tax=Variovorax boronicumulans TaxID=436515 RepID=UPI00278895B1|nr:nucleotidyl transferase AbiEii/AbiGii toxin family protein [Variovorax boronicumulans]MDQ0083358.1 putative nucleotidyltransferase component of viral defense system [Variovorax boronicumulans]